MVPTPKPSTKPISASPPVHNSSTVQSEEVSKQIAVLARYNNQSKQSIDKLINRCRLRQDRLHQAPVTWGVPGRATGPRGPLMGTLGATLGATTPHGAIRRCLVLAHLGSTLHQQTSLGSWRTRRPSHLEENQHHIPPLTS